MRFRIGPVRFGGGRKASLTAGIGPFGVTVGGGRRSRSSGGGASRPVQVNVIDWNSLSFEEKLYTPLREMRHVIATKKTLPAEDQAVIFYKQQVTGDNQSQAIGFGLKYVLPWVFPLIGIVWLDAVILPVMGYIFVFGLSLITLRGVFRYWRIARLDSPTDKQLAHWARVDESVNAPEHVGPAQPVSSDDLIEQMTQKFGADAVERLSEYVARVPRYQSRHNDGFTLQMRTAMYSSVSLAASVLVIVWNFDRACHSGASSFEEWNCSNYEASEDIALFLRTYVVIPMLLLGLLPELLLKRRIHIFSRSTLASRFLTSRLSAQINKRRETQNALRQSQQKIQERVKENRAEQLNQARDRFRKSKQD